jgi:hypothetical protein
VVPKEDIRAVGTADPIHDASEKQRLGRTGAHRPDGAVVFGELFTFDDPEERLPALDRLEGFNPGRPSLYQRVLIPIETSGAPVHWPGPTSWRRPRASTSRADAGHLESRREKR